MQPIPEISAKGSIAIKMTNLTRTYGYFFVAEPTASAVKENRVDDYWSIQTGENYKSILGGLFRGTTTVSEFEVELVRRCKLRVKTCGFHRDRSSTSFLKYSESSQKEYKAFSERSAGAITPSSLTKKRYHGTATWRNDLASYTESIPNPIFTDFKFPLSSARTQLKIRKNNKNTTSRLLFDGSEHETSCSVYQYPCRCISQETYKPYESTVCHNKVTCRSIPYVYSHTGYFYLWYRMMMRGWEMDFSYYSKVVNSLKREDTTVFLHEYLTTHDNVINAGSCIPDFRKEKRHLLSPGNCDKQDKDISEGRSFRIVWVKTGHSEGVDSACSNQVIRNKKYPYYQLRFSSAKELKPKTNFTKH